MDPALVEMVKAGGTLAFCAAVWWELRMQRIERNAIDARQELQLSGIREVVATLTEAVRGLGTKPTRSTPTPGNRPLPAIAGGKAFSDRR